MTRRRSFSAARAASRDGRALVSALGERDDADELAAEAVMQVAHQPRALVGKRGGPGALLLAGETRLQPLLGLAHACDELAGKAVDLVHARGERARSAPRRSRPASPNRTAATRKVRSWVTISNTDSMSWTQQVSTMVAAQPSVKLAASCRRITAQP